MAVDGSEFRARLPIPNPQRSIRASRRDTRSIGADRTSVDHGGMTFERRKYFPRSRIPYLDGLIGGRGYDVAAVCADGTRPDGGRVPARLLYEPAAALGAPLGLKNAAHRPRARVPDPDGFVERRGDEETAIGTQRAIGDAVRVPGQDVKEVTRRRIPDPGAPIVRNGNDVRAVGTDRTPPDG